MTRYVYLSPDGRQFSVYASCKSAAASLLLHNGGLRSVWTGSDALFERPLADEPVTLVDWGGR